MFTILEVLKKELFVDHKNRVSFEVLNPDHLDGGYGGKEITIDGKIYLYRGYKSWTDLAEILGCKMLTPIIASPHTVIIRFEKLDQASSFHTIVIDDKTEKYGLNSPFFAINKNEEPAFLEHYVRALRNVTIDTKKRILNLGINSGDEFDTIRHLSPTLQDREFVGIDFCSSAIAYAKERFPEPNYTFYTHDINHLDSLDLGKFDLIITIGTLQSTTLDFKPLFHSLIQNYLEKNGAIIIGFPNCRWIDGEMIYGAKSQNYNFSEHTLLYKDIYYCKKYLQQKRFRVSISGKNYQFLTATSIQKEAIPQTPSA